MNFFWIILIIIFSIPISLAFASVDGEINFILKKANKFLKEKKFEEAIAVIDEALELDPNHLSALEKKGDALFKLDKNEEALINYEKILEINPNYVDRSGKPLFEKVLEVNPNHILALNKKGENLLKQDSLDEGALIICKLLDCSGVDEDGNIVGIGSAVAEGSLEGPFVHSTSYIIPITDLAFDDSNFSTEICDMHLVLIGPTPAPPTPP